MKIISVLSDAVAALQRLADAQERIAQALEGQTPETGDKEAAAALLNVSTKTVERRQHEDWIEGVHYSYQKGRPLYNLRMIRDWRDNRSNPVAHQRAIREYRRALPSGQKRAS
ncbi:MAG: hypothetical protein AAGB19_19550 [Cyanobacteria bacterium P01_F01_bin.3]